MKREKLMKNELAKLFRTTKETIRHYEDINLISPEVNNKNYKLYGIEEINTLRQVFFLRDLEMPLDTIKSFINEEIDKDTYIESLDTQRIKLEKRIKQLEVNNTKIKHLINLLENDTFEDSFLIQLHEERVFYVMDYDVTDVSASPKVFYDQFKKIVESEDYSEQDLIIIYPYDDLDKDELQSRQCIMLKESRLKKNPNWVVFPEGEYLSVYYVYKNGDTNKLENLRTKIDAYMEADNLVRVSDEVIEYEHPEFSMICNDDEAVFEIQVQVRRKV